MQEEKKWWKKFSAYQIVAFVLTILFVIGIIITIGVLVNLKNKTDAAKEKNKELEDIIKDKDKNQDATTESWQSLYERQIIDFNE